MTDTRGKPGPKPKGDRFRVTAALPTEVVRLIDSMAQSEGADRTAVLGRLLCERLDLPVPGYCLPSATAQKALSLGKAS
jgi:hypothetical protein